MVSVHVTTEVFPFDQSVDLCPDNDALNFTTIFLITFGSGPTLFSNKTPADFNFTTSHSQSFTFDVNDGMFAFVNEVPDLNNGWHGNASDYTTNDTDGYMFLVNMQGIDPQIFNYKIDDLHIGRLYEFSAYVANVVRKEKCLNKPNIRFEVRAINESGNVIAKKGTGDVPACYNMSWSKYDISFETTHSSVVLLMLSNVAEGSGNDLAIDDIELRVYSTNDLDDTSTTASSIFDCKNNDEDYCECSNDFIGLSCKIQSDDVCSKHDNNTYESLFFITFGSGSDRFYSKTASDFNFKTDLKKESWSNFKPGAYAFVNSVPSSLTVLWHDAAKDHTTNDTDGYMYLAGVGNVNDMIFNYNITNLCVGVDYEYSAYLTNVMRDIRWVSVTEPNIRFEVRAVHKKGDLIAQKSTGDIPVYQHMTWSKHGLSFVATSSSVVLLMISNVGGHPGNDLAIDDIQLRVSSANQTGFCYPG
ncbi:unnamed protein product [Rotaria socialis]|uniref:Uncharacterized protein n=1 Tax=Rotaria socialis TaxID=392032 RepID=A0A820W2D2_9BILA|nr:unnamed protein product [Rotaria socialis]